MPSKPQQNKLDLGFHENVYTQPRPEILKSIFEYYRKERGFPFPVFSSYEKGLMFQELVDFDTSGIMGKYIQSDSTSVWLANSYHPHRYDVQVKNMRTAIQVFKNDELLKRCIKKCIQIKGGISDKRLLSMLSIFEGAQVPSNFPTGTAKAIYRHFLPNGGRVWDMSCGWGGRLIAAMSLKNIEYIGTEPSNKTISGLSQMCIEFYGSFNPYHLLLKFGSENVIQNIIDCSWLGTVDLCFTSPPYYDTEKYAREETQSFFKYPYQSDWMKYFIGGTLENCHRALKRNGVLAVNIANVESYKNLESDFVKTAQLKGFELKQKWPIKFNTIPGQGKRNKNVSNGERNEPLFVFTKR